MEDSAEAQATQERLQEALSASLTPAQARGPLPRCLVQPCCPPRAGGLQRLSPARGLGSGWTALSRQRATLGAAQPDAAAQTETFPTRP